MDSPVLIVRCEALPSLEGPGRPLSERRPSRHRRFAPAHIRVRSGEHARRRCSIDCSARDCASAAVPTSPEMPARRRNSAGRSSPCLGSSGRPGGSDNVQPAMALRIALLIAPSVRCRGGTLLDEALMKVAAGGLQPEAHLTVGGDIQAQAAVAVAIAGGSNRTGRRDLCRAWSSSYRRLVGPPAADLGQPPFPSPSDAMSAIRQMSPARSNS